MTFYNFSNLRQYRVHKCPRCPVNVYTVVLKANGAQKVCDYRDGSFSLHQCNPKTNLVTGETPKL